MRLGAVTAQQVHAGGMRFDEALGTLRSTSCAICWNTELKQSAQILDGYAERSANLVARDTVDLGMCYQLNTETGAREEKHVKVLVLVFEALIEQSEAAKLQWEPYCEEKHGNFYHDARRPTREEGVVTWVLQILRDNLVQTALSAVLI